jgi:hypothetical protein
MRGRPDGLPLCPGFHPGMRPFRFGLRLAISVFLSVLPPIAQASYFLPEIDLPVQLEIGPARSDEIQPGLEFWTFH